MAAPQSGTSACARGQLLSSMATAPWQLARGAVRELGDRRGWNQLDAPPPGGPAGAEDPRRELRLREGRAASGERERPEARPGWIAPAEKEPVKAEGYNGFLMPSLPP